MDAKQSAKNALVNVLEAACGERLMVICDDELNEVGSAFAGAAADLGLWTRLFFLKSKGIRKDIPQHLKEALTTQKPDIFVNVLAGRAEETPFRIKLIKMERRRSIRLGHCPGITLDMLTKGALALTDREYKNMQNFADKLIRNLINVEKLHITSPSGTDLTMSMKGREFFTDTKLNWNTMKWMNLPVGEVIVAPNEGSLSGVLVCEDAIGGIGKLSKSVTIQASNGTAQKIVSNDKTVLRRVKKALSTDDWAGTIGEFAFGLNPNARICNEFLETEKIKGTCHIAFGNNSDFPGGKNSSANHMDFLISRPSVNITTKNGDKKKILSSGKFRM